MNNRKQTSIYERFDKKWSKCDKTGCWIWHGAKAGKGYGVIGRGRAGEGMLYAHRVAYERWVAPIPDVLCVCHHCDNPACVNPKHLFCGTRKDNMRDAKRKGRLNPYDRCGERNPRAKLKWADVRYIRMSKRVQTEIAAMFGVSSSLIGAIRTNRCWKE